MGTDGPDGPIRRRFGPGWAVTAAFIGPGTVTTMTLAGARFGYALLWTVVLSVVVAIVLQEMSGRLAIARRAGFGTVLREHVSGPVRNAVLVLVVAAIFFGNAAFQIGNLAGASLGLQVLVDAPVALWAFIVADLAFLALWFGRTEMLGSILGVGVAAMGIAFVVTLVLAPLDWMAILGGLAPVVPAGAVVLVLGTIGTTVVPYNVFLHSSLVAEAKWRATELGLMRRDTMIAVAVGGVLTAAILLTSAALLEGTSVRDGRTMAIQLEPLLGVFASKAFGIGLFLAGMTSAITAPLAAAFAVTQVLGDRWTQGGIRGTRFRGIWLVVLVSGLVPLLFRIDVIGAIIAAQALNGVILPIIAILLLIVANQKGMGALRNRSTGNLLGIGACVVTLLLGANLLIQAVGRLVGP
jgi:manganese transport protein